MLRATTKLLPYLSSTDKGSSASSVVAYHHSLTKRPCFGTLSPSSPSLPGFHKDSKDKVPHLIQAVQVSTNSSSVTQQAVLENEVEQVELLAAVEDLYGGVAVDVTKPMDSVVFASLLQASILQWRQKGEDICEAAVREVKEETGIDTEFVEVLAFRQSHKSFFRKSDLFIVCMLTPKSFDIQEQNFPGHKKSPIEYNH